MCDMKYKQFKMFFNGNIHNYKDNLEIDGNKVVMIEIEGVWNTYSEGAFNKLVEFGVIELMKGD